MPVNVATSALDEHAAHTVAVDGRAVFFYDEHSHQLFSVSTSDGSVNDIYAIDESQYYRHSWLQWFSSFVYNSECHWRFIAVTAHSVHSISLIFFNVETYELNVLLYHLNSKLRKLVLLDQFVKFLPADWERVDLTAQNYDGQLTIFTPFTKTASSVKHFFYVHLNTADGHFHTEATGIVDSPSGVWKWFGLYQNYVYLILWSNNVLARRRQSSDIAWDRIDISPAQCGYPSSERNKTTAPLVRAGRVWMAVQSTERPSCQIWQLSLASPSWISYEPFRVLGPHSVVLRKARGAIQATSVGCSNHGRLRLEQHNFAHDSTIPLLTCPACHQLFRDPVGLRCGHSLCASCLPKCLVDDVLRCIVCSRRISTTSNLPINLALKELISELQAGTACCKDCSMPQFGDASLRCFTCDRHGMSFFCALCTIRNHRGHDVSIFGELKTNFALDFERLEFQ